MSPEHRIESRGRFDAPRTSVVNGTFRETLNDILSEAVETMLGKDGSLYSVTLDASNASDTAEKAPRPWSMLW